MGIGDRNFVWATVPSELPQGSVPGSQLFIIFINDIDGEISSKISKFADDAKLLSAVADKQEVEVLRQDLKRMFRWSKDCQIILNLEM